MSVTQRITRLLLPFLISIGLLTSSVTPASAGSLALDLVRIPATNLDFGDGGLLPPPVNDPVGFGTIEWNTTGGTVQPILNGELSINNSIGLHVRMQLRYYNVFGALLATRHGGEVWAPNNGLHTWNVTNLAPYSNPTIYRVIVSTTYKLGNVWFIKASQTVTI